ncbi:MAG: hypothetical protein EBE86_031860 [Hormoscilla sp. GUM202]|nr:hypothetical protein [Hormoscilla sp. GUM202]
MDYAFDWKPEQALLEKLLALARQRGQSPEAIVTEIVNIYLERQPLAIGDLGLRSAHATRSDPLVGMFAGSPDLATKSETILQAEIREKSGWTWKETQL